MSATYNNLNQITSRGGGGNMPVQGKVSRPANVSVNGKAASVDTNNGLPWTFWAQVPVTVGINQFSIVAKDGGGNASTNTYQLVISGGSGGTYTYDANGNLTSDGARTYTWDAENRLASVTVNGSTSEFTYDGLGRRVKEKVNGTLTKQWIWIGTILAEERDGSNNVAKRFYNQGEEIDGVPYYYALDHLGSIREMADSLGNVVARYQYDSWGRKTKISGSMDSDFGYAGYYYHPISGLNLTLYRAYDSDTARWLTTDPFEEKGGVNLYGYVDNNSISSVDPFGLVDNYIYGAGPIGPGWSNDALTRMAKKTGGQAFGYTHKGDAKNAIRKARAANDPCVNIIGYSRGAIAANEIANQLAKEGIKVDNLILIDPVTLEDTIDVSNNAKNATNYYQTNGGPFEGTPATPAPNVVNVNLTNMGVTHSSMPDAVFNAVVGQVTGKW